ncbi:MAG: FAD-dependent oxidoreductase [Oscillospiraceae bacterium]|nr:FAD-dependent oxidoreductase [Oscillospiraceae bacterium]
MKTLQLSDGLWWNGVLDPNLRVFDIVMRTEFGTTYNSYVLKGAEKTALFETNKLKCWDEYRESLAAVTDIRAIDYIVMNHTEPDHAGTVEKVLELNPRAVVVGTSTAISFLKEIINHDFNSRAVKDGDTLSLGGKTLRFMILPQLHWPDTMYTYVEEDGVLFTCDSFGSHYSHEGILRSTVTDTEGYLRATKYYFDNIIGPFRHPFMNDALDRIQGLSIKMICTGHGPVHDSHIDEIIALYREWCAVAPKADKKLVVIPYVSAYGYTGQLAERIGAGIADACGDKAEIRFHDMVTADAATVAAELGAADAFLLGTPTIIGEALAPIWNLTLSLFAPVHGGKLASAFGSYGWSGEGVPHIIERLRQLRMNVPDDGFRVRLKPSETQLLDAYEYGYNFGAKLMQAAPERKASGQASGLVKCLVCGAVFDASEATCPVCGVGSDKFVPVEDTSTSFRKDTEERFVIVGGGPGAHYAAEAIRERNATAQIQIITAESHLPYNRPMLTNVLLQDLSGDRLAIESRDWYDERKIEFVFETVVQSIDTAAKKVVCDKGTYDYDKLIYALGARCFVVPIPGADKPHVVSIRSIADCEKAQSVARGAARAVVIGGGVMGLESGWELKKGGLDVTVLETAPGLLPRQLDDAASAMLQTACEKAGVHVVTGAKIAEIADDAVVLADGTRYPAELVIMSTGMRGNIAVGQAAGLDSNILIKIDAHCATSAADVWACGDCTEFNGQPHGFWAQAAETGRVAGANAAGESVTFRPIGSAMSIQAMDTAIFALGTNGKSGPNALEANLRTVEIRDEQRGNYEKYYFRKSRLAGVILIGDTSKMADMTKAIEDGATFDEIMK